MIAKPKHFQQLIDHTILEPERKMLVFEPELEPKHYRCLAGACKIEFWSRTGSTALVGTELRTGFFAVYNTLRRTALRKVAFECVRLGFQDQTAPFDTR